MEIIGNVWQYLVMDGNIKLYTTTSFINDNVRSNIWRYQVIYGNIRSDVIMSNHIR